MPTEPGEMPPRVRVIKPRVSSPSLNEQAKSGVPHFADTKAGEAFKRRETGHIPANEVPQSLGGTEEPSDS